MTLRSREWRVGAGPRCELATRSLSCEALAIMGATTRTPTAPIVDDAKDAFSQLWTKAGSSVLTLSANVWFLRNARPISAFPE